MQGGDSPSAPRTKWDLYHIVQVVGRGTGKKEGTFSADVKADSGWSGVIPRSGTDAKW